MSCFDEIMRTIEQLASRQRTELLSLVELHNQQLNDCIRTAKTTLLRSGFDEQRILPEKVEKENQPISVYPTSTTIITTSTSTTTQNDTNASGSKKSAGMSKRLTCITHTYCLIFNTLSVNTQVGDSVPKEKKKRANVSADEVKISTNKRENAIIQTNLLVSKLPPMKLVREYILICILVD